MNAFKIIIRRNGATLISISKRNFAAAPASTEPLVKTALNELHKELGGDMVPFAGYELPVLYKGENGGVMKEHLHCRADGKASLFDVSHMGQVCYKNRLSKLVYRSSTSCCEKPFPNNVLSLCCLFHTRGSLKIRWHGKDRVAFLEKLVVGDIAGLKPDSGCLSLVTNERGGIIDDTVITNAGDFIYMVVNGATKHGDMKHFREQMEAFNGDVAMEYLGDEYQLLALQGPGAAEAVKKILPDNFDLTNMAFMTGTNAVLDGVEGCRITRYYSDEHCFQLYGAMILHQSHLTDECLFLSLQPTGVVTLEKMDLK